jgi:integrase
MKWRISSLKAIDSKGRVVKDAYGGFVLDSRDRRVRGYRLRWYLGDAEFTRSHNKSFQRDRRVEAERLVERLRRAADLDLEAHEHGLPLDAPPSAAVVAPTELPSLPVDSVLDAVTFAYEALKPRWADVPNTVTHHRLGYQLFVYAVDSGEVRGLGRSTPVDALTAAMCQDVLLLRRETNLKRPAESVGISCERGFSVTVNLLLDLLVKRGVYVSNPWDAAKALLRKKGRHVMVTERMVPTQERIVDLADAIASMPGGGRYRVPILAMGACAFRVAELAAVLEPDWRLDDGEPFIRLARSLPTVSARDSRNGNRRPESPLKHRQPGETRDVPLYRPLRDLVREHHDRYRSASTLLFADDDGHPLDLSNWRKRYWTPARDAVFGESTEPELRSMPLRWLRKAAIPWWLQSGVGVPRAALWAGHDPAVLLKYYASADTRSVAAELGLLESTGPDPARLAALQGDPVADTWCELADAPHRSFGYEPDGSTHDAQGGAFLGRVHYRRCNRAADRLHVLGCRGTGHSVPLWRAASVNGCVGTTSSAASLWAPLCSHPPTGPRTAGRGKASPHRCSSTPARLSGSPGCSSFSSAVS